jgi:hypothetical protein
VGRILPITAERRPRAPPFFGSVDPASLLIVDLVDLFVSEHGMDNANNG